MTEMRGHRPEAAQLLTIEYKCSLIRNARAVSAYRHGPRSLLSLALILGKLTIIDALLLMYVASEAIGIGNSLSVVCPKL